MRAAASWDIGIALSVLAVEEDEEPLDVAELELELEEEVVPELVVELDDVVVPEGVVDPVDVVVPEEVLEPVDVVVPEDVVDPVDVVVPDELLEPDELVLPEEFVPPLDVLLTVLAALEASEVTADSPPHAASVRVITIPSETEVIFTLIIPFGLFRRYRCDSQIARIKDSDDVL